MKKHLIQTVTLTIALGTLAGCGNSTLLGAAALGTEDTVGLEARGGQGGKGGLKGGMMGGPGQGGEQALFATLSLSDDQKAQLQAIAEKYRPAPPTGDASARPEHPGQKIQTLLTAAALDVEALKAALAEAPVAPPAKDDTHLARLVETRAVLTAEQIATLVAKLKAEPAAPDANRPSPPAERKKPDAAAQVEAVATTLSLTAEQKAAYQAFVTAMEAARPARDEAAHQAQHEARRAAMVTFWETGDTDALEAAKPAQLEKPAFPVDALVTLATGLSAEQRQQLFARGFGFGFGGREGGKGGRGGHGGRDGHGGQRGPGGPGGFGGFGGEKPQAPADAAV